VAHHLVLENTFECSLPLASVGVLAMVVAAAAPSSTLAFLENERMDFKNRLLYTRSGLLLLSSTTKDEVWRR